MLFISACIVEHAGRFKGLGLADRYVRGLLSFMDFMRTLTDFLYDLPHIKYGVRTASKCSN